MSESTDPSPLSLEAIMKRIQAAQELDDHAAMVRGQYLSIVIMIDQQLDWVLSELLCQDGSGDYAFITAFLPAVGISFNNKIRALTKMTAVLCPALDIRQLVKDLDEVRDFRNMLARQPMASPLLRDSAMPATKDLPLYRWKGGAATYTQVTDELLQTQISRAYQCLNELVRLRKQIRTGRPSSPRLPWPDWLDALGTPPES
jgi:hypothetical protein